MNEKILFKIMNLNLNYLRKMVEGKFEEDHMKNMMQNI